jgi:hypothetical protein
MIQEPFFELPIPIAPTLRDTVVPTAVVGSPMATMNDDKEPVPQNPIETDATDEREQQQLQTEDVPNMEAPRRSLRVRRSAISDDYEVYNTEEYQMEGDPTLYEEAMRSDNSSKWLETIEDEIKSMSTNNVWDLEPIPKGNGSIRRNMTPKGILKDLKHDLWQKVSRKEKGLITMRHFLKSHVRIPLEL